MGVNSFYPIFISQKYQKIWAVDWSSYQRLLPFFILINAVLGGIFSYLYLTSANSYPESVYSALNASLLFYIAGRLRYGRRMITLEAGSEMTAQVAPLPVWLDYISLGFMFVVMATMGIQRTESTFMYFVFSILRVFFFLYSFLPLLNYLKFSSRPPQDG